MHWPENIEFTVANMRRMHFELHRETLDKIYEFSTKHPDIPVKEISERLNKAIINEINHMLDE